MAKDSFSFKRFVVRQDLSAMKVGTDGVLLGAWAAGGRRILDAGCGTGLIALMMAQRFAEARLTALDIDADCCRQARENADLTEWGPRIEVVCRSLQDYADEQTEGLFDAVVSNPPFFVGSLKNPDARRAAARHADSLPFAALLKAARRLLAADGRLSVVLPQECFGDFEAEASIAGFYLSADVKIKTTDKKPVRRHLAEFTKARPATIRREEATLQTASGERSPWYAALTEEFYLF